MKQINIMNLEFAVSFIDLDKVLLQYMKEVVSLETSIPLIGESILLKDFPEVQNLVASESEILIYCNKKSHIQLLNSLSVLKNISKKGKAKVLQIDVCFELGMDWEFVCEKLNVDREKIIDQILSQSFYLINYGFQPGFLYLDGLAQSLQLARRDKPRLKVPKGSLAIGGKYLGVYGSESPGGWHIIGRTSHFFEDKIDVENFPRIREEIKFSRLNKETYLRKHENG